MHARTQTSHRCGRSLRAAILCGALWLQACRTDPAGDLVAQERANVVTWTLPPGGTVTGGTELARSNGGVAAAWSVSTTMTWSDYKTWIRSRSGTAYRQVVSDQNQLSYGRQLPGDALLVDVSVMAAGPPLKLRVAFSAHPD